MLASNETSDSTLEKCHQLLQWANYVLFVKTKRDLSQLKYTVFHINNEM